MVQVDSTRTNLTGDPYYTDGLRAVVFLSNQTTSLAETARVCRSVMTASVIKLS